MTSKSRKKQPKKPTPRWSNMHLHRYQEWDAPSESGWVYARCTNKDGHICTAPEAKFSREQWQSLPWVGMKPE